MYENVTKWISQVGHKLLKGRGMINIMAELVIDVRVRIPFPPN